MVEATATLMHGASHLVGLKELEAIPTPARTETWCPVPHHVIPAAIEQLIASHGWNFLGSAEEKFQISVTPDGAKMFGVCRVQIPGVLEDSEMQMALGFRNSHNKTLALRMALGARVTICDNLMVTGDIQVRREHTRNIDPLAVLERAFERIPSMANRMIEWLQGLREIRVTPESGVALLAQCVEKKALPISDFMDARASFLAACQNGNETILHGGSVWAAYQAVTEQFKKHSLNSLQEYSTNLNGLIQDRFPRAELLNN